MNLWFNLIPIEVLICASHSIFMLAQWRCRLIEHSRFIERYDVISTCCSVHIFSFQSWNLEHWISSIISNWRLLMIHCWNWLIGWMVIFSLSTNQVWLHNLITDYFINIPHTLNILLFDWDMCITITVNIR